MNVVLFGATGMIGSGVLLECLRDPRVEKVLAVGRSPVEGSHAKLSQLVHHDFLRYDAVRSQLAGYDCCFFCLGVSAVGMSEADYHRITYDVTVAAAEALLGVNPDLTFCYVSGASTDSSEQGRMMWARVKGKTENRLLALSPRSYMFRPGFIVPIEGVRSKTRLYALIYDLTRPLYPVLKRFFPNSVSTSDGLGRAMIAVAERGHPKRVLEIVDINALADAPSA
jgi:nucleoside-diphosphate-sugar epimerase